MAGPSLDESLLSRYDGTLYTSDGISTASYRIQISIRNQSILFLNFESGEILAIFDIVVPPKTQSSSLCIIDTYVVNHDNNVGIGNSLDAACLYFRRCSAKDPMPTCLLRLTRSSSKIFSEFMIEFDIGFERDLALHALEGISNHKGYISIQIKKHAACDYSIIYSTIIDREFEESKDCHTGIVCVKDRSSVSDYLWLLFAQLRRGRLREYDINNISRKRNPLLVPGYMGLRCIHCGGLENGNYFPTKKEHLFGCVMRFERHLQSCKRCPLKIMHLLTTLKEFRKKQDLDVLQKEKNQFLNEFWERIRNPLFHGDKFDEIEKSMNDLEAASTLRSVENQKLFLALSPTVQNNFEVNRKRTETEAWFDYEENAHQQNTFTPLPCFKPNAITSKNQDPLTEFLVGATSGGTPVTRRMNRQYIYLNDQWDDKSIAELQHFLWLNPEMTECIDILTRS